MLFFQGTASVRRAQQAKRMTNPKPLGPVLATPDILLFILLFTE
jgi:hypothetical protein